MVVMETSDVELAAGDVVDTRFGVGVITQCPNSEKQQSSFAVLLWRIPGKSIASSSVAYLQRDVILEKLPIAPGMITKKKSNADQPYMVETYYSSMKKYRISTLSNKEESKNDPSSPESEDTTDQDNALTKLSRLSLLESNASMDRVVSSRSISEIVAPEDLTPATSAKFYPLLKELMNRGDQTAQVTSQFLGKEEVHNVVKKTTDFTKKHTKHAMEEAKGMDISLDNPNQAVDAVAGKVKSVMKKEEVHQLMTMIKDDNLTVLIQKGKERLEKLIQQDIPEATEKALEKTGIRLANDNLTDPDDGDKFSKYQDAIHKSRQVALSAMDKLLQQAEVDPNDMEKIQQSLGENFHTMFDSLTQAAKSDRNLTEILGTLNERTAKWQEMTGRLMATKSASVFLEGASRIQARAVTLFSKDQLQWAGEIGTKFTKAFSEGDAAVARLKSIELGDTVKHRLVEAIEVRSGSLGGLDGIIAGALTSIKGSHDKNGDEMTVMLAKLQTQATTMTKDCNETLIAVLAKKSEYRDVALIKLEQVLCNLESQFGEELPAEEIAAIARGEGGTAKLFEPIAKRAAKEIEKQLDVAEAQVSDQTILDVLKHVRKIVSGELTIAALMDDVVNILNDDKVVAAGETLVKQGEQVLDAIEGVSGNKVVDDVMQIAEKAGITKDSVMQGIDSIDVNELLDNAGNAITDERARAKLLSDATDTALDFILRVLPSMPIPAFDGVKDGLVYHISNLSMEGFKVRKENILVEIAGMRATKKKRQVAEVIDETVDDSSSPGIERTGSNVSSEGSESDSYATGMDFDITVDENVVVNATELLIIDVKNVSASFNNAVWGFEQTYMPYLKGNGKFDVRMADGAIRLVFELRKRPKKDDPTAWEPVLCLHDRSCSIGSVEFSMQGGTRLAWVINKAAAVFKGALRDYVVKTILKIIREKSGWILSQLNKGLSPFWDVLLRTAKLELSSLEEATLKDIIEAQPKVTSNLIELVWRENLPLGMNLLLNDESGQLKVVDFPRGSQARLVCEKKKLDPEAFKGATIVRVNGIKHQSDEDLFDSLRDPSRPKTVQFELADAEVALRIQKFVQESREGSGSKDEEDAPEEERKFSTRDVQFSEAGELGIEFANSRDNWGLVVRSFLDSEDGIVLAAARKDNLHKGDLLTHVNGELVLGSDGNGRVKALKLLESEGQQRPLVLTFADPYIFRAAYQASNSTKFQVGGPDEFKMDVQTYGDRKNVVVTGFNSVDGIAEKSGVMLGDHLVFVNGASVGAGIRWLGETSGPSMQEVQAMIKKKSNYPIGLTFARPRQAQGSRWLGPGSNELTMDSCDTHCITADSSDHLGLVLDSKGYADITVKDLEAVPGPFQRKTKRLTERSGAVCLSVESVNGEFVPSFANEKMVKSAMEKSWKSEGIVEVVFCDSELKLWAQSLTNLN